MEYKNSPQKRCDLCFKKRFICPTCIGEFLGESNPEFCDDCKQLLCRLSDTVVKLIIWETNKSKKAVHESEKEIEDEKQGAI